MGAVPPIDLGVAEHLGADGLPEMLGEVVVEHAAEQRAQLLGDGAVAPGHVELGVPGVQKCLPRHPHHRLSESGQPLPGDPRRLDEAVGGYPRLDHPREHPRRLDVVVAGDREVLPRHGQAERRDVGAQQGLVDAAAPGDLGERVRATSPEGQLGGKQGEPALGDGSADLVAGGPLRDEVVEQLDPRAPLGLGEPLEESGRLPVGMRDGVAAQQ